MAAVAAAHQQAAQQPHVALVGQTAHHAGGEAHMVAFAQFQAAMLPNAQFQAAMQGWPQGLGVAFGTPSMGAVPLGAVPFRPPTITSWCFLFPRKCLKNVPESLRTGGGAAESSGPEELCYVVLSRMLSANEKLLNVF